MTTTTTTISKRPSFNWADDDEDDFDLDTWKATADTTAPTVSDLGPLQLPPTSESDSFPIKQLEDSPKVEISTPIDEDLIPVQLPSTSVNSEEVTFEQLKNSSTTTPNILQQQTPNWLWHLPLKAHVSIARKLHLHRALSTDYEGKAWCGAPAYPGFSSDTEVRKGYCQAFHQSKEKSGVSCLYPCLLLNSKLRRVSLVDDVESEDEVGECAIIDDEEDEEMEKKIQAVLEDQANGGFDGDMLFSKEEVRIMFIEWRKQQVLEQAEHATSASLSAFEDAGSVDFREESFSQDVVDVLETEDEEMMTTFSNTSNPDQQCEELAVNDIIFGDETEVHDEGYASSSPLFPPTLDTIELDQPDIHQSDSPIPYKNIPRKASMDTLKNFRKKIRNNSTIEDETSAEVTNNESLEANNLAPGSILANASSEDAEPTGVLSFPAATTTTDISTTKTGPTAILTPPRKNTRYPVPNMPSPDLEYTTDSPCMMDYCEGVLSMGWYYMTMVPWATMAIVAAGVVVGGMMKFGRGR